jgi:acyl-CoA reductase-like NAD-dependent aldehyde dehydrogenase
MGSIEGVEAVAAAHMREAFERQRAAFARDAHPARETRDRRLATLARLLQENVDAIAEAIDQDFGHRSRDETRLLEIFPSLESIRHARRHLGIWMRAERRPVSIWFLPGRARVMPQPLGVVGIIAPWNYPILLAVSPLAAALAAGNRALVKMSEFTPRTSALFARLVSLYFGADELSVVQGDAELAQAFARLPFDHLLFTGSTRVGYAVMRAAAGNLTPVTLELGGKSPAIVGPGYPLAKATERILVGKCMNAGQTCIAPDYVLLPKGSTAAFLEEARRVVDRCYPDMASSPDYTAIAGERHFARLAAWLAEAQAAGARVVPLSGSLLAPDPATRRMPPQALLDVRDDLQVMQEEIFGPLLPVLEYDGLDEAIRHVNARPRPLALYYFDRSRSRIERILRETVAGGVTINDTILHIAQDHLPFGGVGHSGMGHYHGREGFETFSKKKSVFIQSPVNTVGLFKPPYGRLFDTLVRFLIR